VPVPEKCSPLFLSKLRVVRIKIKMVFHSEVTESKETTNAAYNLKLKLAIQHYKFSVVTYYTGCRKNSIF
jgi:hypothetical protein